MSARSDRLEALFDAAAQLVPAERSAFLAQACPDDESLRAEVQRLLLNLERAGNFLTNGMEGVLGESPATASVAEKPGDQIGRYRLLEQIGEGGCATVYMAEQQEPVRRQVALKIIKLGMDTKSVIARFEAERQALALMEHPNIAKVHDAGATESGRPYFVMELVRGSKITEYCDQKSLPTQQRLGLFIKVCQAVQHAHQKGVIHRDIKPSNILVTVNDGAAVPKVIDFGIAKATNDQRLTDKTVFTAFEQFIGTPAYMSPEQAELTSVDIDTRSDIYSLGVLLYELLTGKTPFDSKELLQAGLDELRRTIRETEPPKPSTRLRGLGSEELTTTAKRRGLEPPRLVGVVRGDLDWIVMKCLEKDRARRYETANGLARDIERHLNNEPVVASPPGKIYRFKKLVRRNKLLFGAGAVIGTLLVAGVIGGAWEVREQRRLGRESERARAQLARSVDQMELREIHRAEELFEAGDSAPAVAHLALVLRQTPGNRIAARRLMAALSELPFARPVLPPLEHAGRITWAQFSRDGLLIVTTSADATARVWNADTGQPVAGPFRHAQEVNMADFSLDGQYLVTASQDRTARVWEIRTGRPVSPPLRHEGDIYNAHFSPDGRWVVTASLDSTARVWDAQTGQLRFPPLRSDNGVTEAEFSPDGARVLTASQDHTARIYDAVTGQLLFTLKHEEEVHAAHFSPDGRLVVTGDDRRAQVWDAQTGQPVGLGLDTADSVESAEFSPDGQWVATAGFRGIARVWEAESGQPISAPLQHKSRVRSARFSPDGSLLITTSWDHTAQVWDIRRGTPIVQPLREDGHLYYAEFHPDRRRILTACNGTGARVWDISIPPAAAKTFAQSGTIDALDFSPDGKRFVAASDQETCIWDAVTGGLIKKLGGKRAANVAAFSPDGSLVVTAGRDNVVQVWDARIGDAVGAPMTHRDSISCARFSPDSQRLLTASFDGTARLWDARSGKPVAPSLRHEGPIVDAHFNFDGRRMLTASKDKTVRVWDGVTGQPLLAPLQHRGELVGAQFSLNGQRILTLDSTGVQAWDAHTGSTLGPPLPTDRVNFVSFLGRDGARVLTCSGDNKLCMWDARTGRQLSTALLPGFVGALSPDHQRLATGLQWQTALLLDQLVLWDVETALPLTGRIMHPGETRSIQFSPDGEWLLTTSVEKPWVAQLWDLPVYPLPAPAWVPDLAEALVGERLDAGGRTEFVSSARVLQIKQELQRGSGQDPYARWAEWFFAEDEPHPISPNSPEFPAPAAAPRKVFSWASAEPVPTPSPASADAVSPAGGFSPSENPHGPWSYGYSLKRGGSLILYTNTFDHNGLAVWLHDISWKAPSVYHNPTGATITNGGQLVGPGVFGLHPGPNGEVSIARFTIPVSGRYRITGGFFGQDVVGATTDVHIFANAVPLFHGEVAGFGPGSGPRFDLQAMLNREDHLDFAVGYGPDRSFNCDSTGLAARIVAVPPSDSAPGHSLVGSP